MQEASPFSSLEHTTSFARDLWFNKSPIMELCQFIAKYRKKFGFEFLITTGLSQEKIKEETEEIREIVQELMEEEVVTSNSSDKVVSTGHKASMINYYLNKTPKENKRF
ncbi:hypothetical protein Ahy_A02g007903 [Arachis hypogaea]|uniref:Oxo-4-hydroxy-4-carboxy-5-ureidoimidazoline decarboxylase domain-containing protein n=1 Tax=Arachis hypogaea TaxID=3818 RepID=A0A445EDE7_ARAHY|nr:hypothetical protein Ahy_A02g007903 [Arachis hypogaea]